MSYGHSHSLANFDRAFIIGILLNSGFVAIEAVFGFFAHSLALLADAGHNFGDVLGLIMAWTASCLVKRAPTRRHTYGFRAPSCTWPPTPRSRSASWSRASRFTSRNGFGLIRSLVC